MNRGFFICQKISLYGLAYFLIPIIYILYIMIQEVIHVFPIFGQVIQKYQNLTEAIRLNQESFSLHDRLTGYNKMLELRQQLEKQKIINEISNSKIEITYEDLSKVMKKDKLAEVSRGDNVVSLEDLTLEELESLIELLKAR